jgi:hypothetical protein
MALSTYSQSTQTLTHKLVANFHKAWNEENIELMKTLLDEDAFFKSPFQLQYSRATMLETVLLKNPKVFKVVQITETHSKIKDNVAWSIGTMVSDFYDENGNKQQEQWHNDYVYLFVKNESSEWKLQMLLFHE